VAEAGLTVVDVLKIDTQGTDLNVLRGASAALQSGTVRHVMVEINFVRMYDGQNEALDVVHYLRGRDLHLVDFYEKVYQANTLAWCSALFSRRPGGAPRHVSAGEPPR
jgi:hypothetical protein